MKLIRRRRGVASLIGGVILFAVLFAAGTSYFVFVMESSGNYDRALATRVSSMQDQLQENLQIATALGGSNTLVFTITNSGGIAANVVNLFVTDPSGTLHSFGAGFASNTTPALPQPISVDRNTSSIDTGLAIQTGTYSVKVLTQRGNSFATTYPPSTQSLAAYALASGAIGDLYLTFDSYMVYSITSHGSTNTCPAASGTNSGYCLQTTTGHTGPGFSIPTSTYSGKNFGFSITMTDLNSAQADIILDQFSLIYENSFYGNGHQNFIPWYIATVGTPSSGLIPILNQFQPVVLSYNVPTTVYYIAANCITGSQGPNNSNCENASNAGFNQCCQSSGSVATVFILSNGWKEAPGSYTINNLAYSGTNCGQNSPFVSNLYY